MDSGELLVNVAVGDVIAVAGPGIGAWFIRLGAFLRHEPSQINHVAIVHHLQGDTPWVVEAQADGVVMRDGSCYFDSPYARYMVANVGQPKTSDQRQQVADVAESMLKTPYDWGAISADVLNVFDLDDPWVKPWADHTKPASVVCSSLAAYVYSKVGLDAPNEGRTTTPADWVAWIRQHGWERK